MIDKLPIVFADLMGDNIEDVEVVNSEFLIPENVEVLSTNSIVDQLKSKLLVGQVVKSVEDTYLLYCNYAHAKGFSVKKGDQRYFPGSTELQSKEFECSCEVDQRHLLRSSRNISHAQKSTLEALVNVGISVANVVSYMENEAQGPQNLSFTRKDVYDHLGRIRKHTKVENGDASALLHHFINKANKESNFYWNVQLDDENRVMNFFFRNSRCQVDFDYFGDILSFDTTYRTNRYNLVCAPFVGINHHKQNVMFGLAFMSDETESSFEWLFKTYLEYMNGKQPETIFTDQFQAMMNAIRTVFPLSHHRLCQWHINQNAPSHFESLNGDSRLKRLWNKCMSHCESEEEFEGTWKIMIQEYNLTDHKWLNNMYGLRYKWAIAFSNHKFSSGLLATSRSEVTNALLKRLGNSVISLYDFVLNYEKIQAGWRDKEKVEDTRCHHTKAPMMLKNNPLLTFAADFYTHTVYKLFELELINSLNMRFIKIHSELSDISLEFKVTSHDENSRVRHVIFNKETLEVNCSCKKFESVGILCKHILLIFNFMNLNFLPKPYLKERWMKKSRNRIPENFALYESGNKSRSVRESDIVFVNQIMRSTYALSMRCQGHEISRSKLTEILDGAREQIDDLFQNHNLEDPKVCKEGVHEDINLLDDMLVRNPPQVKSKGITNKNIQRHWDDKSKKKKKEREKLINQMQKEQKPKDKAHNPLNS
ncbi:protein FAR1-RELATED SEQUENCE 5-like [Henckelia pumila]|uniref:protein FAR1-RELATED SEQUENCE 5-like n=1 Tax=Henckelia pumila TaxID=405737 RepID=UPI003C6E71F3